jgi:hypothetical protein
MPDLLHTGASRKALRHLGEMGSTVVFPLNGEPGDQTSEPVAELRWPYNLQTYAQMATDPEVAAVLQAWRTPLLGAHWYIEPNGADEIAKALSGFLRVPLADEVPPERAPLRFSPWSRHLSTALDALHFGHVIFEKVWRYDRVDRRIHLDRLAYRPQDSFISWDIAPEGDLRTASQYAIPPGEKLPREIPIPGSKLLIYSYNQLGSNPTGRSVLRAVYKPWLLKDDLLRITQVAADRNGTGVPVVTYPQGGDRDASLTLAKNIRVGDDAGAAVEDGTKVEMLGVKGQTFETLPVIQYYDRQIAKSMMAMFLELGQGHGALSLGEVFAAYLATQLNSVRAWIEDTFNGQVVTDWTRMNFGEDAPVPELRCQEISSERIATSEDIHNLARAGMLTWTPETEARTRRAQGVVAEPIADIEKWHAVAVAENKPPTPAPALPTSSNS